MMDGKKDFSKEIWVMCVWKKKEEREEGNGEGLYRFLHCLILSLIESLVHFGSLCSKIQAPWCQHRSKRPDYEWQSDL